MQRVVAGRAGERRAALAPFRLPVLEGRQVGGQGVDGQLHDGLLVLLFLAGGDLSRVLTHQRGKALVPQALLVRPVGHDAAGFHHHHPVCPRRVLQAVGHQQPRLALLLDARV